VFSALTFFPAFPLTPSVPNSFTVFILAQVPEAFCRSALETSLVIFEINGVILSQSLLSVPKILGLLES
jgi:hypothetical protein